MSSSSEIQYIQLPGSSFSMLGGVIRSRKSKKDRQYNGQKKKKDRQYNGQMKKKDNNDKQNTTQKTIDGATRTPLENGEPQR